MYDFSCFQSDKESVQALEPDEKELVDSRDIDVILETQYPLAPVVSPIANDSDDHDKPCKKETCHHNHPVCKAASECAKMSDMAQSKCKNLHNKSKSKTVVCDSMEFLPVASEISESMGEKIRCTTRRSTGKVSEMVNQRVSNELLTTAANKQRETGLLTPHLDDKSRTLKMTMTTRGLPSQCSSASYPPSSNGSSCGSSTGPIGEHHIHLSSHQKNSGINGPALPSSGLACSQDWTDNSLSATPYSTDQEQAHHVAESQAPLPFSSTSQEKPFRMGGKLASCNSSIANCSGFTDISASPASSSLSLSCGNVEPDVTITSHFQSICDVSIPQPDII